MRWGIAIALLTASACAGGDEQSAIAITHVAVIDVASGATNPDNTVLVAGNRITYAGPATSAKIPEGATIIDGRGKFLIPGLWDMHVHAFAHLFSDFAGPLMVANGVTGARDMGYYIDTTLRWKADISAGRVIGPRLVVGARVDGAANKVPFAAHVITEEDGVRAVDTLAEKKDRSRRADFIVTYPWIPRAAYFAIVREAKKLGVPVAGHVPYSVSMVEASDSGERSIEREEDLMRACTSRDSVLRARFGDTAASWKGGLARLRANARMIRTSYDPVRCKSVIATLARNHTWVTPTLIVYQAYIHAFDSASTHREWAKYVPGMVQGGWLAGASAATPADSTVARSYFSFDRTRDLKECRCEAAGGHRRAAGVRLSGF